MRVALGIEYDGYEFYGWQAQEGLSTIQGCLEEAISKVAAEPIKLFCAGRTDAGVHAIGQVAHFDTQALRDPRAWILGSNSHLPSMISIRWAQIVVDHFHARFSAYSRSYRYIIYNHPLRSAILTRRVTWKYYPLDISLMQQAAQYFLGEHDFTSFRSSQCEASSPMRRIEALTVTRQHDFVIIDIQANAFLHHMVRNIAGVLMLIGAGSAPPAWAHEVIQARDRKAAAETAPATGLYLTRVWYPEPYAFPDASYAVCFL